MKSTNAILVLVALLSLQVKADGFDDLRPTQQSIVEERVQQLLHDKYNLPEGVSADPSAHQDEYLKLRAEETTKYQIEIGEISPPPAPSSSDSAGSGGNMNQPVAAPDNNSPKLYQFGDVIKASGTVNGGDIWRDSFEVQWNPIPDQPMRAVVTFTSDDNTKDQVAMQFTLKDPVAGEDDYQIGQGGEHNIILYNPGVFKVIVRNILRPVILGNRNGNFNFQLNIQFIRPATAMENQPASHTLHNGNQDANSGTFPSGDLAIFGSVLNSASTPKPYIRKISPTPAYIPTPTYSQPAQNPFHPNTSGGTVTQPTSVAMPGYGNNNQNSSSGSPQNNPEVWRGY